MESEQVSHGQAQVPFRAFTRHCVAHGVPFRLSTFDESTLAAMLDVLPFGTEIDPSAAQPSACFSLLARTDGAGFQLHTPGGETFEEAELPPLIHVFSQQVLLHVGIHAPRFTFVHAGAVRWRGRALLFPGFSCAGKTTLVAELVKLGATYYSDDYAVIDGGGSLHPYACDLRMRGPGTSARKTVRVEHLSGRAGTEPIPIAQLFFTEHVNGARWQPEMVTPGVAVLELLRHSVAARHKPPQVLATLRTVSLSAGAWRSDRGEAYETAKAILSAFDSHRTMR